MGKLRKYRIFSRLGDCGVGLMSKYTERRDLPLSPKSWEKLEALAVKHNAIARFSKDKAPSWRRLIAMIANGELMIVRVDDDDIDSAVSGEGE